MRCICEQQLLVLPLEDSQFVLIANLKIQIASVNVLHLNLEQRVLPVIQVATHVLLLPIHNACLACNEICFLNHTLALALVFQSVVTEFLRHLKHAMMVTQYRTMAVVQLAHWKGIHTHVQYLEL